MSEFKVSSNQTGTLFYSKIGTGNKPYRVRFQSFQQGMVHNKHLIEELDQMHTNYNVFKYGKVKVRRESQPTLSVDRPTKLYKNLKERSKEEQDLRRRLKSMKQTRKSIFQRIKLLKE